MGGNGPPQMRMGMAPPQRMAMGGMNVDMQGIYLRTYNFISSFCFLFFAFKIVVATRTIVSADVAKRTSSLRRIRYV